MNKWHVFTKDNNEYVGSSCRINNGVVELYRNMKTTRTIDYSGLARLINPSAWSNPTKKHYEYTEVTDYVIPLTEVLRIERWDTDKASVEPPEPPDADSTQEASDEDRYAP